MGAQLRFSKKFFNPLYFHIRKYTDDPNIRRIMVYGGKASAKTVSIGQVFAIACHSQQCSALAYRKEQTIIKTTLKNSFTKAIESTYMQAAWQPMDFKFKGLAGNEIIFKGLDIEGKVKGIEGYKYLYFDELDHFTSDEWMTANISLRGIPGQKLFASWNPVDENSWIKTEIDSQSWSDLPRVLDGPHTQLSPNSWVRISADGKTILIKTVYQDNKWIVGGDGFGFRDQNLIDEYESLRTKDENSYNVNVLGEWGVRDKNKKFAWAFSKDKHVRDFVPALMESFGTPYNPNRVVWLSFDFNVNPITCTCMQHHNDTVFVFKCFKLANSNTYALCDHIRAYFKPGTVFKVTGDATGANRNTLSVDNLHNYQIIQKKLGLSTQQLVVPAKNPDIEKNQVLMNSILANYQVWIQPGEGYADPLLYDLTYVEMDANKKMVKDRSTDKKNADFIDTFRYFLNIEFHDFLPKF